MPDKEGGEEDSDLDSDDKPSRRRLWRNATSHYIRENRHPPKPSGPLVHFSRLLVNACLTDNECLIMSFLLGCYSYGKAQSDN